MTDKPPDAIEGTEILLTSLRIVIDPGPPFYIKDLDGKEIGPVFPISLSRRCRAEIIRKYDEPKQKIREYSMIGTGNNISGKLLWGFTTTPQKGGVGKGGKGRSGRHTGQHMTLKSPICFTEIIEGHRGTPLSKHPQYDLCLGKKQTTVWKKEHGKRSLRIG